MSESHITGSVLELRKWQRHELLRTYGGDGCVLPRNIEISNHLDALLDLVDAAVRLRAGMNGHYVNAEDLYGLDTTLEVAGLIENGGDHV